MSVSAISINKVSKAYDLGLVGTGTLSRDLNRGWARLRGKPDPYATLAELNDRTVASNSGTVWALHDITFEVPEGEVLGIIGKNGAGKSTLLKILSQITAPTSGEIKIKGRVASLLEVGTGMHPEMTARQNVYLNGSIMGMTRPEITKKFDEIVQFAGITKYIDTPIKRFSSGMRVRLGFAVAAFLDPEVLIVDEVLAVGDAEFQRKAIGKMKEITANSNRTVLFVSHNMPSIQSLCTSAVLMDMGKVICQGSVDEVVSKYLSDSSESESEINSISTKRRKGSGQIRFTHFECYSESRKGSNKIALSGDHYRIDVHFKSVQVLKGVVFGLGILSATSKSFYSTLRSDCRGNLCNCKEGDNMISFIFPKLPFTAGLYSFNLIALQGGEILDWVTEAGTFQVENGDYYGTGVIPASGRQGVLVEFDFES